MSEHPVITKHDIDWTVVMKAAGSSGTGDPMDQRPTVGVKALYNGHPVGAWEYADRDDRSTMLAAAHRMAEHVTDSLPDDIQRWVLVEGALPHRFSETVEQVTT